jgi:tetratricopeptide (TPR) repeat protein
MATVPGAGARSGVGGRSTVFDEAFVAVADDASAIYWNPAGLSHLRYRYSATLSYNSMFSGLFGLTGVHQSFLALVHSGRFWGIGASLDRLGTDSVIEANEVGQILSTEGSYSEIRASFALSASAASLASVGATGNYFRSNSVITVSDASIDVGVLSRNLALLSSPAGARLRLRAGLVLRNLYHSLDLPQQYSIAAAFELHPPPGLFSSIMGNSSILAMSYANAIAGEGTPKLSFGVEFGPDVADSAIVNHVKLHLGAEYYPSVADSFNWKAGLRISGGNWGFNYTHERARLLGSSQRAAIELASGVKLIQNVVIGKRENGYALRPRRNFETRDDITIAVYFFDDASIAEARRLEFQLIVREGTSEFGVAKGVTLRQAQGRLFGNQSSELRSSLPRRPASIRISGDDMNQSESSTLYYSVRPIRDWFEEWGALQKGVYTVEISIGGTVQWIEQLNLDYDTNAQQIAKAAETLLESADLKSVLENAKTELVKAVRRDPSYPDTYYIAGVVSELSGDFRSAKLCYEEAVRLDPHFFDNKKLNNIAGFEYLKELANQQDAPVGSPHLYETLKQTSLEE